VRALAAKVLESHVNSDLRRPINFAEPGLTASENAQNRAGSLWFNGTPLPSSRTEPSGRKSPSFGHLPAPFALVLAARAAMKRVGGRS